MTSPPPPPQIAFLDYARQQREQRDGPTPTPNPAAATAGPIVPQPDHPYLRAVLEHRNAHLATFTTPNTERNAQLNNAAYSCAHWIDAGLSEQLIRDTLGATAIAIGLTPTETRSTLDSAISGGRKEPRAIPPGSTPPGSSREDLLALVDRHSPAHLAAHPPQPPSSPHDAQQSTWQPQDLTAVLDGQETDPPPALLPRDDGHHLVYAAAIHTLSGEPACGKTWIALYAALLEMRAGQHVTYIDFEDRASRVVGRLIQLGATHDMFAGPDRRFRYVRPHAPLDEPTRAHLDASVAGTSLVILDGVTEAMTLHGLDLSSNPDIAAFYAILPRRIADTGAAVIMVDHVVKDDERQGRWAIGGQHKLAGIDGAAYQVKIIEQFGRGKKGSARIAISKDRPGFVEEIALGRTAAEFHLDATDEQHLIARLCPATATPTTAGGQMRPTVLMGRVSMYVLTNPECSGKDITEHVTGRERYVKLAIQALIEEGYLEQVPGPRGAKLHRVVTHYNPEADISTPEGAE